MAHPNPQQEADRSLLRSSAALDDPYYEVRSAVVAQINRDRAVAGLAAVEFDPLASQVGDLHCQEMAAHRYLSHWNLRGLLPYHRYHLAGGRDHVQENSSRLSVVSADRFPISTQPQDILPNLLHAQARFLAEQPPSDGHRKTLLDPAHTHVGIGFAVVEREFTTTQLFLNRYVRLQEFPEALPAKSISVRGELLGKDYGPYYCVLFYEGTPRPQTAAELNQTYAYSDMTGELCSKVPPWEMRLDRTHGQFHFSVPVKNCGPGFYHLLFWVRRPIGSIPYQIYAGQGYRVDTQEGIPCAGWIFRV